MVLETRPLPEASISKYAAHPQTRWQQGGLSQDYSMPWGQLVLLPDLGEERTSICGFLLQRERVQAAPRGPGQGFYFALGLPGCLRLQAVACTLCLSPGPPWKLNRRPWGLFTLHEK